MKSCLVTGAAGFIGSHLVERLLREGNRVVGIDSFTDYYPKRLKFANLSSLKRNPEFTLVQRDINATVLTRLMSGAEYVFHLAAQPGVRPSWGASFDRYVRDNIVATQRILESCKSAKVRRVICASSSSIYGNAERLPTPEDTTPRPVSPYGMTKLASEHLCRVYGENFGIPVVILRYFTVYGPRQRPDMAFNKFIDAISRGKSLEVLGDGSQARDFTFVEDTVDATVLAMEARAGSVYNVGSGKTVTLGETISLLEATLGKKARVVNRIVAPGDVRSTSADTSRIRRELGYSPRTHIKEGLRRQVEWQLGRGPS